LDCDTCAALITPAIDGELAPSRARPVKDHVESCAACGRRWQRLAQARAAFASLPPEGPSPAFDQRVLAQLETDVPHRRRLLPAALAAAAVLAVIGLLSLAPRPEKPPAPEGTPWPPVRDASATLGIDAGRAPLTGSDCGRPSATSCRVLFSPCASAASCGPES
jgi:hypothetical protein